MKNLFAIPRLPLSEAFTILITLVVCLAGFTEAEMHSKYRRKVCSGQEDKNFLTKESSYKENIPLTHEISNVKGDEFQQNHFAYLKSFPESPLDKLIKRHSDYFGESDESDNEKENDGYGYDDDEYYHFNSKRNDELTRGTETSNKVEALGESNQKGLHGQKTFLKNVNSNEKEMKTIEMLNFKEVHPNIDSMNAQNPLQNEKSLSLNDMARKKTPSSDTLNSLNIIDLKENSALDEAMKDRKEESSGVLASTSTDSKLADAKKVKTNEEKESKIKDSKLNDESEKKDKEASLKEGKEVVAAKNLKEASKTNEDKEKGVKLNENAKLEENMKSKESDTAKIAKEEKETSKFSEKITVDAINPKELSQINNRASFVSSDYKDNLDAIKNPESQGDEKSTEELNENEKNMGSGNYQQDIRESQAQYKGKEYNLRKNEGYDNFDLLNGQYGLTKVTQEQGKASSYFNVPVSFEYQNDNPNEFYNKRESWKDQGGMSEKIQQHQQQSLAQEPSLRIQQEQMPQQPQSQYDMSYENQKNAYPVNFPSNDLENTDYRKNYLKYLKKYKSQNENTKSVNPEPPLGYQNSGKNSLRAKAESKKRKRSKTKKRRWMLSEEMSQEKKPIENTFLNLRRNEIADTFSTRAEKCMMQPHDSQLLSTKITKEDTKLSGGKKYEGPPDSSRLKRKSPQKLEYEIKVINPQNQHDLKNVQFSRFSPKRLKKNVKMKISADGKYLKKYPYSQVSRDDLIRLNKKSESENEKKCKRKAPLWKRHDQKSVIRTRAAPSGYYSNRVKFGQKTYTRNNEKTNSDSSSSNEMNRMSPPYLNQAPSAADKPNQRWESKQQTFKHDPMKRFDENAPLNEGNSLFLVKKGEQKAQVFEEDLNSKRSDDDIDPDQLAKILSKANDYVVLKKTENNKFRKISDRDSYAANPSDYDGLSYYVKTSNLEQNSHDSLRNAGKQISLKNKNLRSRSPNGEKEDKKYSATFHSSSSKSNLKKTFEKFRDLADFFKDNEQESSDNQNSPQQIKEGRDIVFSEDKLPDPIVISSDGSEKKEGLKQKPLNSIYSISTNFKNIDQPDRKNDSPNTENSKNMFTSEVKADNTEFSWEPTLKAAFPEAKTINSMNKNGNEIIVLDFNRNQLKTDHAFHMPQKLPKGQANGIMGGTSHGSEGSPLNFVVSPSAYQFPHLENSKKEDKRNQMSGSQSRGYSVISNDLVDIPSLLKSMTRKNQNVVRLSEKSVKKKSEENKSLNKMSENYNQFLKDLSKLSEINKGSFIKKNSYDVSKKRSVKEIILPPSSFSQLSTYSDDSIRSLGNILQNIITKDSPMYTTYDSNNEGLCKNSEEYEKMNLYSKNSDYKTNTGLKRQGQWFSSDGKTQDKVENVFKGEKEEVSNIHQNQAINTDEEKNYKKLWEEIAEASDKVHRMRREGVESRQLKKAIEDALSFKGKPDSVHQIATPNSRIQEKSAKLNADSNTQDSKDLTFSAENEKNEKDSESQLKNEEESEENSKEEKSPESDFDGHLNVFFENLSRDQNKPSENAWNRKKRKNTYRQKRFSKRVDEDKVSKTEVQNKILKNLPEDNYQSVYSPGIIRKLLSTDNEAENEDDYSDADGHDKNIAEEAQGKCVKNAVNKCVDPLILELFETDDDEKEKSRTRRSLTSSFHSNFKREIDLDESMPNDFQNFLVTSLGGFGSQKREVVKKDEPFWEGKESSSDSYNQIAENSPGGKEGNEDSALEKREVSSSDNRSGKSIKNSVFYRTEEDSGTAFANCMNSLKHAQKQTRSDEKSKLKSKNSEFTDDKLPTQIRIQITNASSKEKKSSKPIMDENETTSTEMENLPKEKEFFDKNKINPLLSTNLPKLHQTSKSKLSYSDYEEGENRDLSSKQKAYRPYRRRKRKKKKYVSENPMKPVKDFITFDQKAMESLLRRYYANQKMISDQTTQKSPVSNHLPQVETVYNPTQGTNKAQLETTRLGKINSINNKNADISKNSLQSNDASAYDEGIIRPFLKAKKMKSEKGELKEFEDAYWKTYSGRIGLGRDTGQDNRIGLIMADQKNPSSNLIPFNMQTGASRYFIPYGQNVYKQKLFQSPYSNYFYHSLSPNVLSSQSLYDTLKLRQELRNRNHLLGKDPMAGKFYIKPLYSNEGSLYNKEEKDKENQIPPYITPSDGSWNNFDYNLSKKPLIPKFQMKDYYSLPPKLLPQADPRSKTSFLDNKKYKKLDFDKSLDLSHYDYLDTIENDYLDDDVSKDSQSNESNLRDGPKKFSLRKLHEIPSYYRLYGNKNSDVDENINEDDEEIDEDYEESADDDELDDYSLLSNSKTIDHNLIKNSHGTEKFRDVFSDDDVFDQFSYFYPEIRGTNFDLTKFILNPNQKYNHGLMAAEVRNDNGPITESSTFMKKVNENSNLFGKNLIKSLNRINNDNAWNYKDKIQDDKNLENFHPAIRSKLHKRTFDWERKLKQRPELPQIGSRLFYAAKTQISDDRDISPNFSLQNPKSKSSGSNAPCRLSRGNPFRAEFVGVENSFETEAGENQKHINGNLIANSEKIRNAPNNKKFNNKDFLKDGYSDMEEIIKENLEGNGGTVSEDNFLENIIGKYIMKKRIKSSTSLKKNAVKMEKQEEESDDHTKHKIRRRSVETKIIAEKSPKILRKRLSSGHLTENNFRKFHKKNFNQKRHTNDLIFGTYAKTADEQKMERKDIKEENGSQKKRSAFDLFKKITNKDRDNKKAENADGSTAGFEPLMSLNEKKYDNLIKDTKDPLLLQDKKLSSDSSQAEIKGSLPELKAHCPNEGQQYLKAQLNERKKEKSKETLKEYPTSSVQGPWKIELNNKYDFTSAEHPEEIKKNFKNVRVIEKKPFSGENENLKAFLVISKNIKDAKRNSEGLFHAFGPFLREVGNSYRPKSDEGRGISKRHVRKRSLEFPDTRMTNRAEDTSKTSDDQITKELNKESRVNLEEKNRALHDTKSFSEGDSDPQAPHFHSQSDNKQSKSFVIADEQFENSRFLPKERLIYRKSVFPPSSDENIIRGNRQINEETSEYLGQQIVDAILSHVSANPKFKEIIAPGLVMRATANKEKAYYNKKRALHEVEFSEQFQTFLKKFMFDLEKLAEKHVKKRMCHQIDRQSKLFLQSLLNVSVENSKKKKSPKTFEKISSLTQTCSETEGSEDPILPSFMNPPETLDSIQMKKTSLKIKQHILENLKMKHYLLLKLLNDYQNLLKPEKEALVDNYRLILQELDQTNKELMMSRSKPHIIIFSNAYEKINLKKKINNNCKSNSFEAEHKQNKKKLKNQFLFENCTCLNDNFFLNKEGIETKANSANNANNENNENDASNENYDSNESSENYQKNERDQESQFQYQCFCPHCTTTINPPTTQIQKLPVLYFSEVKNPDAENQTVVPPLISSFETVQSVNSTEFRKDNNTDLQNNKLNLGKKSAEFKDAHLLVPTPQSFDLLPSQSTTPISLKNSQSVTYSAPVVLKDEKKSDNYDFENYLYQPYGKLTELHKLSLGDAAGLQLSLKNRGPWVSNLDVVKTVRSVLSNLQLSTPLPLPKTDAKETHLPQEKTNTLKEDPLKKNLRNSRSLNQDKNKYLAKTDFDLYWNSNPIIPYNTDKQLFFLKPGPFEDVIHCKWPLKGSQICPNQYILRKSPLPSKKKVCVRLDTRKESFQKMNSLRKTFGKKRKTRIPHFLIYHPKGFVKKLKKTKSLKNSEN